MAGGPTFIDGIIDGLAQWLAGPLLSMELSMGSLNGWLGPLLLMELSMGSLNGWRAHFYRWNY
jgi:hypothetical protein